MNIERFKAILEAYGADPDRWPEAERDDAVAFLRSERSAQAAHDAAAELDGLLAPAAISAMPSEILTARLLRAVPQPEFLADWKRVAAAAALALAIGLGGGYVSGTLVPPADEEAYYEIAFDGLDSEVQFDWEGGA
ncbi:MULTISPECIES: hypothetical protein [Hyphobacterium]|uniref:Uncharacterized protein n=1 Tax=Hyphobacterium vulgare TaxID=1736751 RepID=A0ABV6ZUS1_9PROT